MPKELPYFKFFPTDWLTGDIVFEPFDIQGAFINICALYWNRDGNLTVSDLEKRFKLASAWRPLIGNFIHEKDGNLSIKFLDEQLTERNHISSKNSENGRKGGESKALKLKRKHSEKKRVPSESKQTPSQLEEEKELELEKEYRKFKHLKLTLTEFDKLVELGWSKEQVDKILDSIENYKKNTSYTSLYLTSKKWLEKEYSGQKSKPNQIISAYQESKKLLGV